MSSPPSLISHIGEAPKGLKAPMDVEQKAQVTELYVPMDCRGCVHKIKRALHNLDATPFRPPRGGRGAAPNGPRSHPTAPYNQGVYEVYIDVSQQKLTVVGRVDPEKIVKVIKRTRKTAAICPPPAPASAETPPPPEPAASTESTSPATGEAAPASDPPSEAPPAETPAPEVKPEAQSNETAPEKPKIEEQIHMIHYYPHSSIYRERWNAYPRAHEISQESFPHCVIQNYYGYKSFSSSSQRHDFYGHGNYQSHQAGDGGQITSIFSDENPNACAIV